jgi:hypothetical protein
MSSMEGRLPRKPERQQGRSDEELRRQRKEVERQWNTLQGRLQRERDNAEERIARVDGISERVQAARSGPSSTRRPRARSSGHRPWPTR